MSSCLRHLAWIPAGALAGFGAAYVFGDVLTLPVDLYYLIYITVVLGFLALYVKTTGLDVKSWSARRLRWAIVAGVAGGLVLMRAVLARPPTPGLSGAALGWALLWRGVAYGSVDGLLLLAFPWIAVWRAFEADRRAWPARLGAATVAWLAVLAVTTAYHAGYADFRSPKIVEPNVGSAIGALPTILTANPVASPISHVFLHVTAVLHCPATTTFLPPHREAVGTDPGDAGAPGR